MGENWQAKIEATNSIILPFTTVSFHCDTTPFCRPLLSGRRFASECGGRLAAMLSSPPRDPWRDNRLAPCSVPCRKILDRAESSDRALPGRAAPRTNVARGAISLGEIE